MNSLTEIAKKKGVHRTTLSRRFSFLLAKVKLLKLKPLPNQLVLILDGKRISRDDNLILSYEYLSKQPFAWMFDERENFNSFGSRRGNHETMMRGTFGNVRLKNLLAP